MAYSRTADFTTFARWPATQWRTELEAVRDELMGGLANADVANGAFGLQNLAQPRALSPIALNGAATSTATQEGAPFSNNRLPPDDPAGPLGYIMALSRVAVPCVLRAVDFDWEYVVAEAQLGQWLTALTIDIAVCTREGASGEDGQPDPTILNLIRDTTNPSNMHLAPFTSRLSQRLDIMDERIDSTLTGTITIEDRRRLDQRTSPTLAGGWIPAGAWFALIAYVSSARDSSSEFTIVPFNRLYATVWVETNHRT